ncbi:hypothetical protein RhiJN_14845 [Ceratobasidium sp. AG-Ba]|nr:hypothetical protein RhiJN_14845 [Ceratobasidium sp. AG-Ba]
MATGQLAREFIDSSVERSLNDLLARLPSDRRPRPISIATIHVPNTPWADATARWTKDILTPELYNHSRRSYFYAAALLDPELAFFPQDVVNRAKGHGLEENMWLTAMLHDITLVKEVQDDLASQVSFNLQGGIVAHEYLSDPQPNVTPKTKHWGTSSQNRATPDVALSKYQVVESIVLHLDPMLHGRANLCARATHLGIMLDAVGGAPSDQIFRMWHPETIANGAKEWRRNLDPGSAAALMEKELRNKPGCHSTTTVHMFPNLCELLENNPYFPKLEPNM